jgi:hypothetical protein
LSRAATARPTKLLLDDIKSMHADATNANAQL